MGEEQTKNIISEYDVSYMITVNLLKKNESTKHIEINGRIYFLVDNLSQGNHLPVNVALLMLTSGTTNIPKAVMLTDNNIKSSIESISTYMKLESGEKVIIIKNLSHISSLVGELLVSLYNHCIIYMSQKLPSPRYVVNTINKEEISVLFSVPTLLNQLAAYIKSRNIMLVTLTKVNFYGSHASNDKLKELFLLFPNANIIYSYGLTEASPRVTYIEKEDLLHKLGSCGKPVKNVKVMIFGKDGELGKNQIGEIVVKGPNVMAGYYKNPIMTELRLKNGLLFTGDYGYLDNDDYLYYIGRTDNMLTITGKNIHPEEVEKILESYPAIIDSIVVPVYKGEDVSLAAFVTIKNCESLDLKDVKFYCKQYLEIFKIPREIHVVNELKKTRSGKIIRHSYEMLKSTLLNELI